MNINKLLLTIIVAFVFDYISKERNRATFLTKADFEAWKEVNKAVDLSTLNYRLTNLENSSFA